MPNSNSSSPASIQSCVDLIPDAIETLIQLGAASKAYEITLWLANHAYERFIGLCAGSYGADIDLELAKLLRRSEKVCTLIAVSCSLEHEESEDVLKIASDLSLEVSDRVLTVFVELNHGKKESQLFV